MKYISPYYKVFGKEFLWQIIYTSPIYEPFDPSMIATDSIERIIIDSFFDQKPRRMVENGYQTWFLQILKIFYKIHRINSIILGSPLRDEPEL